MSQPNPSIALARVIIDEIGRHGVDFIVLSPGSRSGALAIAAAESKATTRVVVDERSAAFWALGRAKATGVPAVVISTSGTAPANYLPAVVEADMSLTPLLVISADRPAEMIGIGANQTIDQVDLFGDKIRFSATIEAPDADVDGNESWRSTVSRALNASVGDGCQPGPVHLNVAFREPTVPVSDDGRSRSAQFLHPIEGRADGRPWIGADRTQPPAEPEQVVPTSSRGIVIAGDGVYDRDALFKAARAIGWPLLATALSGLRGRETISKYHYGLSRGVPDSLRPEVVVAVGSVGPSERLEQLIGTADLRFRVDGSGRTIDPSRNATRVIHGDPVEVLGTVEEDLGDRGWSDLWLALDRSVGDSIDTYLGGLSDPTGPGVAATLNSCDWDTLVAASSLPIRDVDSQVAKAGRVIGNRGASGIDGFISTALGVASAGPNTIALSGDLSLLHDINGFLADQLGDLLVIVVDNDGGGLFDLLPQASHAPHFERLFVTPHHLRLEHLSKLHDLGYREVRAISELGEIVSEAPREGISLIRVPVDRKRDLAVRHALDEIGSEAARSVEG